MFEETTKEHAPLAEQAGQALAQPYPLLAANLDDSEIRAVYRQPPALSGVRSNAASVKARLLEQISDSHCGLLPKSQMPAMLAVQQQRDRRMAERLLAAPTPALLLAGAWHARKDVGVPLHLSDLDAGKAPIVLMLAEQGVNLESLLTEVAPAPMSGELLFTAEALLAVPETLALEQLQARLETLADDLMVELVLRSDP